MNLAGIILAIALFLILALVILKIYLVVRRFGEKRKADSKNLLGSFMNNAAYIKQGIRPPGAGDINDIFGMDAKAALQKQFPGCYISEVQKTSKRGRIRYTQYIVTDGKGKVVHKAKVCSF